MDDVAHLATWQLRAVVAILDGRQPGKPRNRAQLVGRVRRGLERSGRSLPDAMAQAWREQPLQPRPGNEHGADPLADLYYADDDAVRRALGYR